MRVPATLLVIAICLAGCGGGGSGGSSAPPTPMPPTFTVGGTVSGLKGSGLTLRNGPDTVTVAAGATGFTFSTRLAASTPYAVTISAQPGSPAQTCTLANAGGTVTTTDVTTVAVSCRTDPLFTAYALRGPTDLFAPVPVATLAFDPETNGLVTAAPVTQTTCRTSITANRQKQVVSTVRSTVLPGTSSRCSSSFGIVPINGVTTTPDFTSERSYASAIMPAQAIIHPNGLDFYVVNSQSLERDYPQDPLIIP